MAIIEAQNLTMMYGTGETAVMALSHVNLSIAAGDFVAVMGPSGCGNRPSCTCWGGWTALPRAG